MDTDTHATKESFSPEDMVNASELREFLFCERAWFLGGQGLRVTAKAQSQRDAGIAFHEARAEAANRGRSAKPYLWALLLAAAAVALLVATALMDRR
jgi:hypothetical protein